MSQEITPFEAIRRTNPAGNEFWSSRDFARVLGYVNYRHFQAVIEKARTACFNSGQRVEDHFVEVTEMVGIGSGVTVGRVWRQPARLMCARPANDLPNRRPGYRHSRPTIVPPSPAMPSLDQTVFDYAIFQNHGYIGLYGGLGAQDIHARKGLKKGEQILDHMGSTERAANLFRATQAEDKLRREKITGKDRANRAQRDGRSQSAPDHQGTRRHHA